jgi:hypothetical protein
MIEGKIIEQSQNLSIYGIRFQKDMEYKLQTYDEFWQINV